jgi:hypothetical protein
VGGRTHALSIGGHVDHDRGLLADQAAAEAEFEIQRLQANTRGIAIMCGLLAGLTWLATGLSLHYDAGLDVGESTLHTGWTVVFAAVAVFSTMLTAVLIGANTVLRGIQVMRRAELARAAADRANNRQP